MRELTVEHVADIALGATVLGTGGGGDPYIGKLMAQDALRHHGPVRLIDPSELADDDLVIPAAMMGAPTAMLEKLPKGSEIVMAFKALEAHLARPATAVMSPEAGGLNSTLAFVVAAELDIPLVDADSVGRAFPELQMGTPNLYGVAATPLALADDKGNTAIVTAISNPWAERLARSLTVEMGCWAMVALYAMSGEEVRMACIPRTISFVERIGRTIREARTSRADPVAAIRQVTNGHVVWRGKVSDIARRTAGGFVRGEAAIAGVDGYAGRTLTIAFQNEFLIALDGDEPVVTTPDLITVLDAETGEPITTETLRYGFRVVVLGIPCDPRWRTRAGLQVVGPSCFGYDVPFVPIETRVAETARAGELVRAGA